MTGTALTNALSQWQRDHRLDIGHGSDGNINVNDPVSWSANTLTLNATNNIYVNNVMTATGTASFAANYGYVLDSSGTPRPRRAARATPTVRLTGFIHSQMPIMGHSPARSFSAEQAP